jgi:hypothetical protein
MLAQLPTPPSAASAATPSRATKTTPNPCATRAWPATSATRRLCCHNASASGATEVGHDSTRACQPRPLRGGPCLTCECSPPSAVWTVVSPYVSWVMWKFHNTRHVVNHTPPHKARHGSTRRPRARHGDARQHKPHTPSHGSITDPHDTTRHHSARHDSCRLISAHSAHFGAAGAPPSRSHSAPPRADPRRTIWAPRDLRT